MVIEQTGTMKENKSPVVGGIHTNFFIETPQQLSIPLMFNLTQAEQKEVNITFIQKTVLEINLRITDQLIDLQ